MRTKNWEPTADQKRWHDTVRRMPCIATIQPAELCQLHHIWGASFHYAGKWVGQWGVINLVGFLHDSRSNHFRHVAKHKAAFIEAFGTERELFLETVTSLKRWGFDTPPDEIVELVELGGF